ncbi:MAG: hypothetical protein HZA68_19750 [Rhodovulum sp.]|jgi:hypothetical protein|nr:hypothetical protein [Rhodovulum sp.]
MPILRAMKRLLLARVADVAGLLIGPPDPRYWPERHYMRGPGPKWREKQARGGVR